MRCQLVGLLLTVGACYGDPDRFNAREAQQLCKLERDCSDWEFGLPEPEGVSCEEQRTNDLGRCNEVCEYDEDAARECIRGLRRANRPRVLGPDCGLDDDVVEACAAVYTQCEPDPGEELFCEVPDPSSSCAVVPNAPASLAWLLLPWLGWWRRRRG